MTQNTVELDYAAKARADLNEILGRLGQGGGGGGSADISNAEFQAALDLLFPSPSNWNFVDNTVNAGDAILSTDNNAYQGSTTFLALQFASTNGAAAFAANLRGGGGDYVLITRGANEAVMAEIAAVRVLTDNTDTLQVWLGTELWTKGLTQYGQLTNGAGTVAFHRGLAQRLAETSVGLPDFILARNNAGRLSSWPVEDAEAHLLGPDTRELTIGDFTQEGNLPSTRGKFYISGGIMNITPLPESGNEAANGYLDLYLKPGQRFRMERSGSPSWLFTIGGNVNKNTVANGGYGFSFTTIQADVPSGTNTWTLVALGHVMHWTDTASLHKLIYDRVKAIVLAGSNVTRALVDSAQTLTLSVTKAAIYALAKSILTAGTSITITANDTAETLTVAASSSAPTLSVWSLSNIGQSWTTLQSSGTNVTFADNDWLYVTVTAYFSNETNNVTYRTVVQRYSDYSTNNYWIALRGGAQGARVEVRRQSGGILQFRRQGAVGGTNTLRVYRQDF